MIAKAIANEAKCNFISKNGSEFDDTFVGKGAEEIRKLFKKAKK